jgi:Fic family protein
MAIVFLSSRKRDCAESFSHLAEIVSLKASLDQQAVMKLGRRAHTAQRLYNFMYTNPIFTIKEVSAALKLTPKSANSIIEKLIELEVIREMTGGQRGRIYSFDAYLILYK